MTRKLSGNYSRYIYSAGWKKSIRRKIALNLLFGLDPILPFLPTTEVEHLNYKRVDFNRCEGFEIPIVDIIGLNRFTHRNLITPGKDILRSLLGRKTGNAVSAWFVRFCLFFWYFVIFNTIAVFCS